MSRPNTCLTAALCNHLWACPCCIGRKNQFSIPIYTDPKITPEQKALLDGPNSHQYPSEEGLSDDKDNTLSLDKQASAAESSCVEGASEAAVKESEQPEAGPEGPGEDRGEKTGADEAALNLAEELVKASGLPVLEVGEEYTVATSRQKGEETFVTFYTNRKAPTPKVQNTQQGAHIDGLDANNNAKIDILSEIHKDNSGKKFFKTSWGGLWVYRRR